MLMLVCVCGHSGPLPVAIPCRLECSKCGRRADTEARGVCQWLRNGVPAIGYWFRSGPETFRVEWASQVEVQ
jgi:hypothetical protein